MSNKQKRFNEAVKRLEYLKKNGMSYTPAVDFFKKKNDVGIFECQNQLMKAVFYGLYLNQGQEEYDDLIGIKERLENENNITVYLILINYTNYGKMITMLYVSDNEDEYEYDWDDLKYNNAVAYGYIEGQEEMMDVGTIEFGYDKMCGGIYRRA